MSHPVFRRTSRCGRSVLLAVTCLMLGRAAPAADVPPGLAGSCVAVVPADACFLSATLRAREQWDCFVKSNAWATLRSLPAVQRAFASLEEQRRTPGTVPAQFDRFVADPDNAQALDLLADMVATDTFVYGEPSCVTFVHLFRKLSTAVVTANSQMAAGPGRSSPAMLRRMLFAALAEDPDLIVVPDVVWGFRTTKLAAAQAQLARLVMLSRMAGLAESVAQRRVAGGDFLVLTLRSDSLPWDRIERDIAMEAGDIDGIDEALERVRNLRICIALGIIGDRVILSIGDSTDHLEKLAAGPGKGLLTLPAFAPLLAHADERISGVSYVSADLAQALGRKPEDLQQQLDMLENGMAAADIPEDAIADMRAVVERFGAAMTERTPKPGMSMSFSFLTESGYEGYAWDWSQNQPLDGTRRLDLLEHAGGAPLAVVVSRLKSDPQLMDDLAVFVDGLVNFIQKHGLRELDDAKRERAQKFIDQFEVLGGRLGDVVRGKLIPSLADGQVGFVLDGKSRTKKPSRALPASGEPLPLPELALILPLTDAKLFRDGLTEISAICTDAVAALREIEPGSVPRDFRLPEPEKSKVEAGTVWSFPLAAAGLDEQFRPALGVGEQVAAFSSSPKQAARLLGAAKLETGSQLSSFEEPLAGAAVFDVAGLVDAVKPWILYWLRYGFALDRTGDVDADTELRAADDEPQAREVLAGVEVGLEVAKCLRAIVSETEVRDGAVVTHWRNIIRDLPKKP